jgi:hypothetical protein
MRFYLHVIPKRLCDLRKICELRDPILEEGESGRRQHEQEAPLTTICKFMFESVHHIPVTNEVKYIEKPYDSPRSKHSKCRSPISLEDSRARRLLSFPPGDTAQS